MMSSVMLIKGRVGGKSGSTDATEVPSSNLAGVNCSFVVSQLFRTSKTLFRAFCTPDGSYF